jgi:hypothetical protein
MEVIIKRSGERNDHLALVYLKHERWLRSFHIGFILHLYKLYGEEVQVDGGTLRITFRGKGENFLDALLYINPRSARAIHWHFREEEVEKLNEIFASVLAEELHGERR